jgi:hypothetical protein
MYRYTTINRTIALFNVVFDKLDEYQEKTNDIILNDETIHETRILHQSLKAASELAYKKLSKYYSKYDLSEVYTCATVLDHMLKFEYWSIEQWVDDIIESQKQIFKTSWENYLRMHYENIVTMNRSNINNTTTSGDYIVIDENYTQDNV